ncbi:hypothetical protein P389DRAFT_146722 [Cystobasidium minutum MCA 4210]|uniref:uncharacterized protein n=1 Tax=Cystobasidium minutum MCA 4210 TaxID=1397322 RepID=UPI0034CD1BAC|eukprot:jgi/Rhomi1/146722/e_gw1.7.48.1
MPPKTSSSKRKAKADESEHEKDVVDEDGDSSQEQSKVKKSQPAKKAKVQKEPVKPLDPSLPTNITFPINLTLEAKPPGTTRLACWNVCGINSCIKKGFDFYVKAENPDVLILTETKVDKEVDHDALKSRYPYRVWGADPKKGQSGTAVFSKTKPKSVKMGLPTLDEATTQGRCLTLEFENYYLVATYTPNSGDKLKNMDYKKEWNVAFEKYLRELDAQKPVIWGGDFNCAPTEKDIRHAKPNWDKTPGYTKAESDGYFSQLQPAPDSGYQPLVDVWREKHPDAIGQYTYYSYRFKCREKGIGWRLDSFILSERIADKAKMCEIRHECYGASDHVPVVLDLEGSL